MAQLVGLLKLQIPHSLLTMPPSWVLPVAGGKDGQPSMTLQLTSNRQVLPHSMSASKVLLWGKGLLISAFPSLLSLLSFQFVSEPSVSTSPGLVNAERLKVSFVKAFASRGAGAFGDILYGDCQYYSRGLGESSVTYDNQAFPKDMVAGLASADPDYPGSCGRCYEIQ